MFLEASYCKVFAMLRTAKETFPTTFDFQSDSRSLIRRFLHTVIHTRCLLYSLLIKNIDEVLWAALGSPNQHWLKLRRVLVTLVLPTLFQDDLEKTGPEKMKYSVTIQLY